MFSGFGAGRNNPAATGAHRGPIPVRSYEIKKVSANKNARDWFLDPGLLLRMGYRAGVNRGGFNLHLRKGASYGCVTASQDESDANLSSINDLLNWESGNNSLEVTP
jgi:hypothetical protein